MASPASAAATPAAITLKDQTFDQASKLSLAEQLELAMTILKGLKKAVGGKKSVGAKKAAASASEAEEEPKEKKVLTPAMAAWHANLKVVRTAVQAAVDPKFSLKNAMSVAKALRTAGSWPAPSQEAILEAYEAWKDGASPSGSASSSVASSQPSKPSKAEKAVKVAASAAAAAGDSDEKREAKIAKMKASLAAKRAAAAAGDPISAMTGEQLREKYESLTGKKKPSGKFTTKSTLVEEIKRLEAGTSDLDEVD